MSERMRTRNAADPEQVEKARKRDARDEERFADALHNVMNMKDGRVVMTTFLRRCGVGIAEKTADAFDNSGSVTARNLGTMDVGFWLQDLLKESTHDLYQLMEREARDLKAMENRNG